VDLNHGPRPYQGRALTELSYGPLGMGKCIAVAPSETRAMINSRARSHLRVSVDEHSLWIRLPDPGMEDPHPKVGVEIEIISPGGLEDLFREFGNASLPDPETLAGMAARYGTELDFEGTMSIIERHGLVFLGASNLGRHSNGNGLIDWSSA
jgi:hypothetical protein